MGYRAVRANEPERAAISVGPRKAPAPATARAPAVTARDAVRKARRSSSATGTTRAKGKEEHGERRPKDATVPTCPPSAAHLAFHPCDA